MDVTQEAKQFAEQQKNAGVERVDKVADAMHDAAHELDRQVPQASEYIHKAASRLEDAATAVRERSIDDLAGQVGDFARRQPAIFFGGALLAGLAFSRFLKSSSNSSTEQPRSPGGTA
ncbi:MAG TPA: hypothetical protein VHD34_04655 [Xanthobacteraceae bacterium]|nr:hypothetical protein [Xanthobacteraceae bacterium]